jgi:uncharacterized cupin superfamily protein
MGKYDAAAKPVRKDGPKRDDCIANIDEIEAEPYEREKDGLAGVTWDLGAATGARLLGIDVTEIPPGKKSSTYHCHSLKEEFFYVLSGRCRLRLGAAEHELRAGDAVSRPAGTGVPHQFHNPFAEPCRLIMIGVNGGKGVEDVVEWPDLGRLLVFGPDGERKLVRKTG